MPRPQSPWLLLVRSVVAILFGVLLSVGGLRSVVWLVERASRGNYGGLMFVFEILSPLVMMLLAFASGVLCGTLAGRAEIVHALGGALLNLGTLFGPNLAQALRDPSALVVVLLFGTPPVLGWLLGGRVARSARRRVDYYGRVLA